MTTTMTGARRRYRILDLVGRGGGGCVYRARLESADGFAKEVALKIVRADISAAEITRFRDEARILGLVRDRALVNVEPPIRLGSRWALVMEFVDGVSVHQLTRQGPVPPRPALEIVAEVARVLHKIHTQLGPDGRALELVHRDIKPANLQVTPEGDVKLLDFGVARARFDSRETVTHHAIAGTRGYIAPERLIGREGPEGDVYSLGVMLHVIVTGDKAVELGTKADIPEAPLEIQRVLALAERMRGLNAALRPPAAAVHQECLQLAAQIGGPDLREWASQAVPRSQAFAPDDLVGATLTEMELSGSIEPTHSYRAVPRATRRGWAPVVAVGALGAATLALCVVLLVLVVIWLGATREVAQDTPPVAPVAPVPVPVAPVPVPVAPVPVAPVPVAPEAEPGSLAPSPPIRTSPAPAAPSRRPPAPAAVPAAASLPPSVPEPVDEPVERVAMALITFDSDPPGAVVQLNGVAIGRTPLRQQPVSHGEYELRLEQGERSMVRTIRISGRGATSYTWAGEQLLAR